MWQPPNGVIIAYDPGEWTGIVVLGYSLGLITHELPWLAAVSHIHKYASGINARISGERFDMQGRADRPRTAQTAALRASGAVEYTATLCNATFEQHSRADCKRITDKMLKSLGWYTKTKDGHINDAARVLCQTLLVHHPVEYLRLLELPS